MTEAELKMARAWFAKEYQRRNRDAEKKYSQSGVFMSAAESRDELVGAFAAGLAAERELCAKLAEAESQKLAENSKRCDKDGNTFGGTVDAASASTLKYFAAAIRKGPQCR